MKVETTMAQVKLWPWRLAVDQPWVLVMVVLETGGGCSGYSGVQDW